MPAIRFRNRDEFREWNNDIKHIEAIISLANDENKELKQFCEAQLRSAQFWKRYALERMNDGKLREIALNCLEQTEVDIALTESTVPAFLAKMPTFLKQFQITN
jgi:hypothetical protein